MGRNNYSSTCTLIMRLIPQTRNGKIFVSNLPIGDFNTETLKFRHINFNSIETISKLAVHVACVP